jgi:hypothetical protein
MINRFVLRGIGFSITAFLWDEFRANTFSDHPELEPKDFLAIFQFLKILSSGNVLKEVA